MQTRTGHNPGSSFSAFHQRFREDARRRAMTAVIREAIEPADAALPALLECDRALVKIGKRIRF